MALRILHIEDDESAEALLRLELRAVPWQAEVVRVANVTELQRALAGRRFDVVLSDWWLPGLDGARAHALVRAVDADAAYAVVTGADADTARVAAGGCGIVDVFTKDQLPDVVAFLSRVAERA